MTNIHKDRQHYRIGTVEAHSAGVVLFNMAFLFANRSGKFGLKKLLVAFI